MKGQGSDRSHNIPEQYNNNMVKYILGSPTAVVEINDIEGWKILIKVKQTTISGANIDVENPIINVNTPCGS